MVHVGINIFQKKLHWVVDTLHTSNLTYLKEINNTVKPQAENPGG